MNAIDPTKYDSDLYENRWFDTSDGLQLNYRIYGDEHPEKPSIIAIPGLTRCARDIDPMAQQLAENYRIYALNLRGRDLSAYDPDYGNYNTRVYMRDIYEFWRHLEEEPVVVLGSSLGALLAMLLAEDHPDMLAGIVLNDLGATIEMAGMARIFGYAGKLADETNLKDVIQTVKSHVGQQFVDLPEHKWERMALAMYDLKDGKWHHRYDDNLGKALVENHEDVRDLWQAHQKAADRHLPILSLRGELSDVTSAETIAKMQEMAPGMMAVEIPDRGHCPILDEPQSIAALKEFMGQFKPREHFDPEW